MIWAKEETLPRDEIEKDSAGTIERNRELYL